MGDGEGAGAELRKRFALWRDKLFDLALFAVPTLLVQHFARRLADGVVDQPWQAVWIAAPVAGVALLGWLVLARRRRELALRGPLLIFFIAYATVFSVAASSDLLDWRRELVVRADGAPRSWLLPARFGDWRYLIARRERPLGELLVVTVQPTADLATGRQQILQLVARAKAFGATGLAFDFHLRPETSPLDQIICGAIAAAELPVIFGHHLKPSASGRWLPEPIASGYETCLPAEARGHVMVLRDADNRVRFVPLRLESGGRAALSQRVAGLLAGEQKGGLEVASDGYLQPLPPAGGHPRLTFAELEALGDAGSRIEFRGSFLLVGEDSEAERFRTPLGERLGVEIHADAVHSLLRGAGFRRAPPWLTFGLILVLCYLETALAAAGAPTRRLIKIAGLASVALIAGAAVAAWERIWIDVVYGLVALWLLVPALLVLRRLRRPAPEPGP